MEVNKWPGTDKEVLQRIRKLFRTPEQYKKFQKTWDEVCSVIRNAQKE